MREIWFALLFVMALARRVSGRRAGAAASSRRRPACCRSTPQDRVLGKADAPITIVEYASMTCPHCAHFDE